MNKKEKIESLIPYIGESVTEKWQNLVDSFGTILDMNNINKDMQYDWERHIEVIANVSSIRSSNLWKMIERFVEDTLGEFTINDRVRLTSFICIDPKESKNKEDDCRAKFICDNEIYTIEFSSPTKQYVRLNVNDKTIEDTKKKMARLYMEVVTPFNMENEREREREFEYDDMEM